MTGLAALSSGFTIDGGVEVSDDEGDAEGTPMRRVLECGDAADHRL